MTAFELDFNTIETTVALEIYNTIMDKYNSVPQLSVETLFFQYYEHIETTVNLLFEYWLQQEMVTYQTEKEKAMLLESNWHDYSVKLTAIVGGIWQELNFTYVDTYKMQGDAIYIENTPLREVW